MPKPQPSTCPSIDLIKEAEHYRVPANTTQRGEKAPAKDAVLVPQPQPEKSQRDDIASGGLRRPFRTPGMGGPKYQDCVLRYGYATPSGFFRQTVVLRRAANATRLEDGVAG